MYIGVVAPTCPTERRGSAAVRADGAVEVPEAERRRLGASSSVALECVRVPEGLLLVAPGGCLTKVHAELTTDCNLDCAMCIRRSGTTPGGTMSAETFAGIVKDLADWPGAPTLQLSGFGEPMAHPQFFEFLASAKAAGLAVEVVTNGTLLDREALEQIVGAQLDRLIVSIDGLTAASSEKLHADSLAAVEGSLRALHALRVWRGLARPEVAIEFVATRRNIRELPALRRLAPELGFTGILVTNLIPYTPELDAEILYERWTTTARTREASPWNPCVDLPFTDAHSPAHGVMQRLLASGAHARLNGVDMAGAGPKCRFITEGRLAIRWDGQVSPCLSLLYSHTYYFRGQAKQVRCYPVGNVGERPLRVLWEDPGYRRFRERVRRFEFAPCIDCGGCDLRETNEEDCFGDEFPRCGECLWAAGLVQCP